MLSLVPHRLLPAADGQDALVISVEGGGATRSLSLGLRRRRQTTSLGRFQTDADGLRAAADRLPRGAGAARAVALQLGSDFVLERRVVLPGAVERDVRQVLNYEMDRFTPFTPDAVVWDCQIERRDRSHATLELKLWLVPRRLLHPLTDMLLQIGITPTWLEVRTAAGAVRRMTFGGAQQAGGHNRLLKLAAATAACLAIAVLATPFVTQSVALGRIDRRITAMRPLVAEAEALRRRVVASTADADIIATERTRIGDMLQVLATVTDALPDNTVLTDLSINRGKLSIAGQSSTAARLISALSTDPTIHNPSFAAPVTRAPDGQTDAFAIRAELAP